MSGVEVGQEAPEFALAATGNQTIRLSDYRGRAHVVLYFYPKDNTPGCTDEGQAFRDQHPAFNAADTVILGVSRDSIKAHENFKAKHGLPFELLSDKDETACQLFDVIKQKTMYGKQVRGIERSTFLIDKQGLVRQAWRKVKVPGHVDEVLAAAQTL